MRNKKRSRTAALSENENLNCSLPSNIGNTNSPQGTISRRSIAALFSNHVEANSTDDDELNEIVQAPKRLALQDSNISRYEKEFLELSQIGKYFKFSLNTVSINKCSVLGSGEFGFVFHCLNRLDGCDYAIKKSKKPVAGSAFE